MSKPAEMRDIYRPTPAEKKKCASLLAALSLPAAAYARYRGKVQAFLATSTDHGIARFGTRKSVLFGREYLTAYADAAWLKGQAPGTDAIAAPSVTFDLIPSPQLVLMPESKEKAHDPAFLSILEHEFVHVHQFLLGAISDAEPDTAKGWLREIFRLIRAEYEANFIQLVRWPMLYSGAHGNYGISLEDYCALRGYTQCLQRIFHAAAVGKLTEQELLTFLERLPAVLPSGFRSIGLGSRLGKEYAEKLPTDVVVTLDVLSEVGLDRPLCRPALGRWLKKRLDPDKLRRLRSFLASRRRAASP